MKSHVTDVSFYKLYLEDKVTLAPSSVQVYCEAVSSFLKSNPDIDKLEDYNNFIIAGSIKKRCHHYYSALKHFIDFKIEESQVRNRILDGMIKPRMHENTITPRKHLSEEDILGVINSLEFPKHKIIALIQTLTGVRAGDIFRLKRDNIISEEYEGKVVLRINITGKGGKRNVIYIHDDIAQTMIFEYISNVFNFNEYYFIELGRIKGRKGRTDEFHIIRLNYLRYWDDLKQALAVMGIDRKDFASHDFRRCFARRAWERWKDVHILQGLLNHSNPTVTLKYLDQSGLKNIDYHAEMQK